ncbi:MAG: hypothetical protein R3B06_32895 [Kofleriaceae bacterium]
MTLRPSTTWRRVRWVLAFVGLCTVATCPAAISRCAVEQTAAEAPALLRYLVEQVRAYVTEHGALPVVSVGPTPPVGTCCASGATCAPDPDRWLDPSWRTLRFSIDGRHRFSYKAMRDGEALVLSAFGDLDCDSTLAKYEVRLTLVDGKLIEEWRTEQPLE